MQRNILIVEDNDVNLELIVHLIRQYNNDNGNIIKLFTARNGLEAVELCAHTPMDIIFMDLMMPMMNGNEATKVIKAKHPQTMIIVISSYGDEGKQKEMLNNGAEDYMIKPVNAALFKSRLRNYIQLIQTRNHIGHRLKVKNIFTSKVYNYHMDFNVASDADLSEFWEAILMRLDFQRHIYHLSDFVRFIYRIGTIQLQHGFKFHIYVEEDTDSFFFTMDNIQLIGCRKLETLISKYYPDAVYLCQENALSFLLHKAPLETIEPDAVEEKRSVPEVQPLHLISKSDEEVFTFNILDAEELEDFEEYLLKLRSLILLMENSSLEASDIEELCYCFDEMASLLSISNDTYVLSNALRELSNAIASNKAYFHESSNQLFDFINAFVNDLIFWKNKIFYEGAPSVGFLNDSITTNANMLNALLQPEKQENGDIDDIFDF